MALLRRQRLSPWRGQGYDDLVRSRLDRRGDLARYACLVVAV